MSFLRKITLQKVFLVVYNWIAWVYWQVVRLVKQTYNLINFPVYILEGKGPDSAGQLRFMYAGFYNWTLEYWAQTAFPSGFQKHALGRKYIWEIFSLIRTDHSNINFLLIEHSSSLLRFFTQKQKFYLPHWTYMDLDISLPLEKLFGRQRPDVQRKIRKNSLSYFISKDEKDFSHFYHNMYLPYTKSRHVDEAVLFSYQHLLKMFIKGGLILVQKGEDILGAGMFEIKNQDAYFRALGVLDGKWEYTKIGVVSAIYFFLILEMKKNGYKKLFIGGARPLLSDGVSKFKASIGARILPDNNDPGYMLILNQQSGAVEDFLIKNPLATFKNKKPYRAVFAQLNKNTTQKDFDEMLKETCIPGLAGTEFYYFNNPTDFPDHIEFPKKEFTAVRANNVFMRSS